MTKFDTCFFERYAKFSLISILGQKYAGLENKDRPDLQDLKHSIGIEVTRAMSEDKKTAQSLVDKIKEGTPNNSLDENKPEPLLYTFGLYNNTSMGSLEFEYWRLAMPLKRILKSKVKRVGSGLYGDFQEFGLYIFSKDFMNFDEIYSAMNYTIALQQFQQKKYQYLYISQIQELSVCDLQQHQIQNYEIDKCQAKQFYQKAIQKK